MNYRRVFRVLVLDDEEEAHARARNELDRYDVKIKSARSIGDAKQLLAEHFFDIAFVDLSLKGELGISFLAHMSKHAPSCPLVVTTAWTKELGADVLSLLGGGARIIGVSNKLTNASNRWYPPFFLPIYKRWLNENVNISGIDGADGIAAALVGKRSQIDRDLRRADNDGPRLRTKSSAVEAEVYALIRSIFGPTTLSKKATASLAIPRIIRSGYSSSVVAEAVPTVPVRGMETGVLGNRCVLKVGPRPELETEIERYNQVVRFGVALEYRVELLGSALGDSLGVVCYSFAGSHKAADLVSLQDLLNGTASGDGWSWREILQDMFTSDASNWYSIRGETRSLSKHFESEYRTSLLACHERLEAFFGSLCTSIGVDWSKPKQRATEQRERWWKCKMADKYDFILPMAQFLTSNGLSRPSPGCLSHGDLHGGNILLDPAKPEATFRFIDYRNAGLSPRLLDISALHASVRLAHVERDFGDLPKVPTAEAVNDVISSCFGRERALLSSRVRPGEDAEWVHAASLLDEARKVNFDDATEEEVLWAQFAHCLSLFRINDLGWRARLRLTCWLAVLTERLVQIRERVERDAADGATRTEGASEVVERKGRKTAEVKSRVRKRDLGTT